MILRVFGGRLIRMVGPRATAAAAAPAVVTNCRRSIPFRLVMDLPSIHLSRKSRRSDEASPRLELRSRLDRVHHAHGDLGGFLLTSRRPCGVGAEVLDTEL